MSGRSPLRGLFLLASLLFNSSRLLAEETEPAQPVSWAFYWENDSFLTTDRYYTNGLRLTRTYSADSLPRWAHRTRWMESIVDRLPRCTPIGNTGDCYNYEASWTFGQNFYTPENLRASRLLRTDRPYGGWLYYGNVLTLSKPDLQHTLEIDLGAVGGSLALGEPVQSGWHSFLREVKDSDAPPDPKGWHNQINNQLGLQLIYQGRRRVTEGIARSGVRYFDLVPQVTAGLGTVNVQGSVGAMARFGYNVPDEFPPLVIFVAPPPPAPPPGLASANLGRPASLALPAPALSPRRWQAYVFAQAEERYVAYSAFLDGNIHLFGKSHSVPKEPLVTDLLLGAVLGRRHWRLSVTWVDRSEEFKAQRDHQRFVSLTVQRRR